MSGLRHIRESIRELVQGLPIEENDRAQLVAFIERTRRRAPIRKAPPREEPKVTRSMVAAYFRWHPNANNQDAAAHFGVNTRAISYAYRGRRYG